MGNGVVICLYVAVYPSLFGNGVVIPRLIKKKKME